MNVSVVIPTYRRPDSLLQCLDGLLRSRRLPTEVVVVIRDTDTQTAQVWQQWVQQHGGSTGVRWCTAFVDRPGQIAAMNQGLATATGEVVCFIDDDCVPREDWLEQVLKYYQNPQVGGVGGRDLVHQDSGILRGRVRQVGRLCWWGRLVGNHHLDLVGGAVEVDHLKGANMSFRRHLLRPFDERMSGGSSCLNDTDASLWVRSQGYRLIYDPDAVVDHYPAPRFGASTRVVTDPALVYSDSHNWVYCLLRYMKPVQKVVFVAYALLVGGGTRLGLVKWLLALPRGPRTATRQFWAATRGKLAGVRTYLQARRELRAGRDP